MKYVILFFCLFAFAVPVCAEQTDNVAITWDYPNPPTDLAGFDIRVNEEIQVVDVLPELREWIGEIVFLDGENVIDMRAKDLGGQVSVWSEPCYYDPFPLGVPINLTIKKN